MTIKKQYIFCFIIFLIFSGCKRKHVTQDRLCSRVDLEQITKLIPQNSEEIYMLADQSIAMMNQALNQIDQVAAEQRTYVNTVLIYEQAYFQFFMNQQILKLMAELSIDSALQTAANVALLDLDEYESNVLKSNVSLFQALQEYEKYGKDPYRNTKPVSFFLNHELQQAKQQGMHLNVDQRAHLTELEKDVKLLAGKFRSNIMHDQRYLLASEQELKGLSSDFIETLSCDDYKNYIVPINQKNYDLIMQQCINSSTRRNFYMLFKQIGYPQNESILCEIKTKLSEIARLLDFDDWATYQLTTLSSQPVKKIEGFLHNLTKEIQAMEERNFISYISYTPLDVLSSVEQKLDPWDYEYVKKVYIKKHFALNDDQISQYFVLDRLLPTLLKQLSKFFNITFEKQEDVNIWAPGVICYRVRSLKHQAVLGYIFFDLYQRFAKRDTDPYEIYLIPVIRDDCSIPCVGATVVVANFKQNSQNQQTLLTFQDVSKLVYQIGQALHSIFAATRFTKFSGHQVTYDFANISGQTLTHWLHKPAFVQSISSHLTTLEPLSRNVIEKLIARDVFEHNSNLLQELFLSFVALKFFQSDSSCDLHVWIEKLYKKIFKHKAYVSGDFFETSFIPFSDMQYGAAYYADIWNRVIAADLFSHIQEHGILNHEIGMQYVTDILSHGGAKNPSEMIKKFLGRSVSRKAFVSAL